VAIFRRATGAGPGLTAQVDAAQKLYAALARQYDDETRFITGIRKQAIAALALRPGETVVDAGCGTGWCLPMLAEGVGPTGTIIGFEPTEAMLAIARTRAIQRGLTNARLLHACGNSALLDAVPDAILFSYTHDLIRSREALANIFCQARSGSRIVSTGTKLFPRWFFPGNRYLRHTHRATITNFDSFHQPWTILAEFCSRHQVQVKVPGSRYLFTGILD